jgi:hypothetical protein
VLATKIATKMNGQLNEVAVLDANPGVFWNICHLSLHPLKLL